MIELPISGLEQKRILITGGAGSLGKEFLNALKDKHEVWVVDSNEWAVAELDYPRVILDDFANVSLAPYDLVIHCAAYKHVDLGEGNPVSFVDNNVDKTAKLFKDCFENGIPYLFISTDKAVKPISLYGMTKAIGEKLAIYYGGSVARLGNIVGSSGSVIPLWEKAIRDKQPIPITDERMVRYFIEAREAVDYIWMAFQKGEKVIIPPMQKVRLLDLLSDVLGKHGYLSASDYEPGVTTIGMRPGEKLEEELEWDV